MSDWITKITNDVDYLDPDWLRAIINKHYPYRWQPIDTAPKDGTWILGTWDRATIPVVVQWRSSEVYDIATDGWYSSEATYPYPLTKWCPFPDTKSNNIVS